MRKLLVILSGNALEFYSFMIFIYFIDYIRSFIFGEFYIDEAIASIYTYGLGFAGYISRPLGALCIGHFFDTRDKGWVLNYSIILTSFVTLLIPLNPFPPGIISVLYIIILRFFQGMLISGEEGGAAVILSEMLNDKKYLASSLVLSSVFFGILIGSAVNHFMRSIGSEAFLHSIGWKIPFMIPLPMSLIIFFFREKYDIRSLSKRNFYSFTAIPMFAKHWEKIIKLIIICSAYASLTCFMVVYIPNHVNVSFDRGMFTFSLMIVMLFIPFFGYLSDKYTGHNVLQLSLLLTIVLSPVWTFSIYSNSYIYSVFGFILFSILVSGVSAPLLSMLVQYFGDDVKCSGVSFVFNASISIFSGLFPIVALFLRKYFASEFMPIF
ncbi:MAG: MFS transporter, partial [Romboutsia sp.]|nr:MFS transporter [Romboutsia sp.]